MRRPGGTSLLNFDLGQLLGESDEKTANQIQQFYYERIASGHMAHEIRKSFFESATVESTLTPAQVEVDELLCNFSEQASDWHNLTAMMMGGLANRLAKIGVLGAASSAPTMARVLAPTIGLFAEVSAYRGTNQIFDSVGARSPRSGSGNPTPTMFGKEFLTDYLNFATLKIFGNISVGQNPLLAHALQDGGMVAGHQITYSLALTTKPEGSIAQQFIEAETMNLAMSAGMSLGHFVTGRTFTQFEKALELQSKSYREVPSPALIPLQFKYANFEILNASFPSEITERGPSGSVADVTRIKDEWIQKFPYRVQRDNYAPEIVEKVFTSRERLKSSRENLLQFSTQDRGKAGTFEQLRTIRSFCDILDSHASLTPTASLETAFADALLVRVLSESDRETRLERLGAFEEMLQSGMSRSKLEEMLRGMSYDAGLTMGTQTEYSKEFFKKHRADLFENLRTYTPEECDLWLNWLYRKSLHDPSQIKEMLKILGNAARENKYDRALLSQCLEYARNHPLGEWIMDRVFQVLVVEDPAYKLVEIVAPEAKEISWQSIEGYVSAAISPPLLNIFINGSSATGFVDHQRLANKVISVAADIERAHPASADLAQKKERIVRAIFDVFKTKKSLDVQNYLDILNASPTPQTQSLYDSWRSGELNIVILPSVKFDEYLHRGIPGMSEAEVNALYVHRGNHIANTILLREIPPYNDQDSISHQFVASEVLDRLIGLVHEWEHWRHYNGYYELSDEKGAGIVSGSISRELRIVTEMMAHLEEERWRHINFEQTVYQDAERMGQNLAQYLRDFIDIRTYAHTNRQLMARFSLQERH